MHPPFNDVRAMMIEAARLMKEIPDLMQFNMPTRWTRCRRHSARRESTFPYAVK